MDENDFIKIAGRISALQIIAERFLIHFAQTIGGDADDNLAAFRKFLFANLQLGERPLDDLHDAIAAETAQALDQMIENAREYTRSIRGRASEKPGSRK